MLSPQTMRADLRSPEWRPDGKVQYEDLPTFLGNGPHPDLSNSQEDSGGCAASARGTRSLGTFSSLIEWRLTSSLSLLPGAHLPPPSRRWAFGKALPDLSSPRLRNVADGQRYLSGTLGSGDFPGGLGCKCVKLEQQV
jgi:hypothetical protein